MTHNEILSARLPEAISKLQKGGRIVAFTGAGISVESGIPSFRGPAGLWSKYDPVCLDIDYFYTHSEKAWAVIKEIFYDFFGSAKPNEAHIALSKMENAGILHSVITQNIDNLHHDAGSTNVYEFHGNSRYLRCLRCDKVFAAITVSLAILPPRCECGAVLKPDFVFFGEAIPEPAQTLSFSDARQADVMLLIGTTGEVYPAAFLPHEAKHHGATIIEINPEHSEFTRTVTDIYLQGKATVVMRELTRLLCV